MREGRFFRNPDFQLRDCGASAPDVSCSQKVFPSRWTHPVIVTPGTTTDCAVTATSGVEGAFGTTGFLVSTLATADARTSAGPEVRVASMPATSVSGGGGPAV